MFRMVLAGFGRVVRRMLRMSVRGVGVMCRLFMVAALVMLGSFPMVACRVLVMIGSARVVLSTLVLGRHGLCSSGCGFSPPSQSEGNEHNHQHPALS